MIVEQKFDLVQVYGSTLRIRPGYSRSGGMLVFNAAEIWAKKNGKLKRNG